MGPYFDPHLLSWVTFLPLGTALLLLGTRVLAMVVFGSIGAPGVVWRSIAMGAACVDFLFALTLWGRFDPEETGLQLVEHVTWLPDLGIHYFVAIDGVSLILVLVTTFCVPLAILSSWNEVTSSLKSHSVLILLLETSVLATLVSQSLFQIMLSWEMTLIAAYFLMGRWGGAKRFRAATKLILFGLAGSMSMFIAVLIVHGLHLEQTGVATFDLVAITGGVPSGLIDTVIAVDVGPGGASAWWRTQHGLFALFTFAFAVKLGMFPFHGWFVDAQARASTLAALLISVLLLELAALAFIRIALPLFSVAAVELAPWMRSWAAFGVVYASLLMLAQTNLRRLVAYSSLAQLGLVVLGVFSLNVHALSGAVIQLASHGLCVSALLILVGSLAERRGTHEIEAFGGLAKPMPLFSAFLALALLAHVGVPGAIGFVGEFLIVLGGFGAGPGVTAVALGGWLLGAAALLSAYRVVTMGPLEHPENRGLIDLDWRERSVLLALLVPILWVGFQPNPVLRRIEPGVSMLLREVQLEAAAVRARIEEVADVDEVPSP